LRAAAETAGPDVELELYDDLKEVPPYDEHGERANTRRSSPDADRRLKK
jgi:hypothetical protein